MEKSNGISWVDTHCHLEDSQFNNNRRDVLHRAEKAGVRFMLTLGSDIPSSRKATELAHRFDAVFAGIGIHPHEAKKAGKRAYSALTKLSKEPKVVAIGEVGLDFYRNNSPRGQQEEVLRNQIRLAKKLKLPLVLHEREAHDDMIRILKDEHAWEVQGVIHCFTGGPREVENYVDLDFFVSLAGPVTFSKSTMLQEAAKQIPLDRLMVETDSPYLTPVPFRGKRPNEPAMVVSVAEKVAELFELPLEDLARITNYNAHALFGIPTVNSEPQIVYKLRDNVHVNLTYNCTNNCYYCPRFSSDYHFGHNLKLEQDPSVDEVWRALKANVTADRLVTFSGYGEPFLRLDVLVEVARRIKSSGGIVRVLTNGQGNLIQGRNIVPDLEDLVDKIRISLHAGSPDQYMKASAPMSGEGTFESVLEFIREAKKIIPDVEVVIPNRPTMIDVDMLERMVSDELGVRTARHDFAVYS